MAPNDDRCRRRRCRCRYCRFRLHYMECDFPIHRYPSIRMDFPSCSGTFPNMRKLMPIWRKRYSLEMIPAKRNGRKPFARFATNSNCDWKDIAGFDACIGSQPYTTGKTHTLQLHNWWSMWSDTQQVCGAGLFYRNRDRERERQWEKASSCCLSTTLDAKNSLKMNWEAKAAAAAASTR